MQGQSSYRAAEIALISESKPRATRANEVRAKHRGWIAPTVITMAILSAAGAAKAQTVEFYRTPEAAIAAGVGRDLRTIFTNLRAAQVSKAGLEGRITAARAEFLNACGRGSRDPDLEKAFANALRDKDFYYFPFYGGPDRQRALQADRITGGAVDSGIRPSAEFPFIVWAKAMMAAAQTGGSISDDDADHLEQLYARYVNYRNEAEIKAWTENRKINAGPATSTPDGIADTYTRMLRLAADARYGSDPDKAAAFQPWIDKIHAQIIAYETAEPSIEDAVSIMRRHNFKPDIIQHLIDTVKAASPGDKLNQGVLLQAYYNASREQDRRNGLSPRMIGPGIEAYREGLKHEASNNLDSSIEDLVKSPPYPLPFRSFTYGRDSIIHGSWTIDAPPPSPGTDWCTGKPVGSTK